MLQHLTIQHYALIEHLDIDFSSGFSVITGETGAGKSIILGALNLLLGGRGDAKAIQSGEKKCMIEASFAIGDLGLEAFFTENDIDYDANDCIVRREVLQSGKSRAFINDTPVTATRLKELGSKLIDIHSQHQNLLIRNEHFLIDMLDIIAAHPQLLSNYKLLYEQCKQAELLLEQLQDRSTKGHTEQEYIRFQLNQFDEAQLQANEQEDLEAEHLMLGHAEEIKQDLYKARNMLSSNEISITQQIRVAVESLENIAENYPIAKNLAERLQSIHIELEDIETELERATDNVEYDPARLEFVEERLSLIYGLQQRHNASSIAELLSICDKLRSELDSIENLDEDIKQQTALVQRIKLQRNEIANKLSDSRKKAAIKVQTELIEVLRNLGMPNVQIEIQISPRTEPDATGADKVMFLFSANKNVPMQDVSSIASGGEIARLMLALKSLIVQRTSLPTIVFDEIDTGVSGTMADRMAQVMKIIAQNCQVICITHLPQIAALGSHHFKVYKEDSNDTTHSHIIPLDNDDRVKEIAHMLSGEVLTQAAIDNAKVLIGETK